MIYNITKEKRPLRMVLFIHGFSDATKKCLDQMRAHHIATIRKKCTPISLPDINYHPNKAPGTHARHQSACAPGAIRIMLITREANPKIWKTQSWKAKTAARLALALQVSVRNGGHKEQVGKLLGKQNISPDNIKNHMKEGGPQYINTLDQIMAILGISAKHMKQNPKTPPHWRKMLTQPREKKWLGKIKRALRSITFKQYRTEPQYN
jgi:hypothetical protein